MVVGVATAAVGVALFVGGVGAVVVVVVVFEVVVFEAVSCGEGGDVVVVWVGADFVGFVLI